MKQPIQAVSLPPDDAIVEGVCEIANALYRKRGYAVSITESDTRTVLEAVHLMVKWAQDNVENTETESGEE